MKHSKVIFFALGLAAAFACVASSCSDNNKDKEQNTPVQEVNHNLKFVSYNYDMIAERADSDYIDIPDAKYVRYHGEGILPEVLGDEKVKLLRDSIEKLAGISFTDYNSPVPVTEQSDNLTDLSPINTEAASFIGNTVSASLVNPRIVVFEVAKENYEWPAAHGMETTTSLNYCLNDGNILLFDDIFKPGSKAKILQILKDNIKNSDIPLIVELNNIEVPDEFSLLSDGIDFIYQPYDIAPYSEGSVRVKVSLFELVNKDLLTPEGFFIFTGK